MYMSYNVNTHNLKFARRDRLHILASHWCEAFENLLHIDIAPGRRMIRDFTLKKIKQWFLSEKIYRASM